MQSLSNCMRLESLFNILLKYQCLLKGNVYSYRFRDIAVRKYVGIVTRPAGHMERIGLML